jgi:putative membrane protein
MLTDALLAFLHFTAIFVLVTLMTAEAVVLRPDMTLATGLLRLFYGAKGVDFLIHNPWFHAKMTVFVLIALCSLPPTLAIAKWRKQANKLPEFVPTPAEIKKARRWVMIEAHLFILLPLCAVMMARGIGMR